jgi:hypothetical protein
MAATVAMARRAAGEKVVGMRDSDCDTSDPRCSPYDYAATQSQRVRERSREAGRRWERERKRKRGRAPFYFFLSRHSLSLSPFSLSRARRQCLAGTLSHLVTTPRHLTL